MRHGHLFPTTAVVMRIIMRRFGRRALAQNAESELDELAKATRQPDDEAEQHPSMFNDDTNFGPEDHGERLIRGTQPIIPFGFELPDNP